MLLNSYLYFLYIDRVFSWWVPKKFPEKALLNQAL